MLEDNLMGKYFSITDPENINTIIYQINRTDREFAKNGPKYTVERLEFSEEIIGTKNRKTFFVDNPAPEGNPLVIISLGKDRVVANMGFLDYDTVKISKMPKQMKFTTLFNEEETEFKDFAYTPDMQRPITIIDPDTGEEIKPILYFDEESNQVKGKCKLKPFKRYLAFEVREKK